jgi:hypothetical protein
LEAEAKVSKMMTLELDKLADLARTQLPGVRFITVSGAQSLPQREYSCDAAIVIAPRTGAERNPDSAPADACSRARLAYKI